MATVNKDTVKDNFKETFSPTNVGKERSLQSIYDPAGFFGGGGGSAPAPIDPYADKYGTDADIQTIADRVNTGQFQFGNKDQSAIAIKQYNAVYGRNPTVEELNQAMSLSGGDINGYIAGKKYADDNSPEKLASKQRAQYLAQAPEHYGSVNQLFQSNLGRAASQDELSHFGSILASGTTDQYELQNFLQQQPEYQQNQDKNFRGQLSGELQGYDKSYFQNSILPGIQESYAKQGRSFDSSAFQGAATNSAQQQNTSRESFLANLSAQQYGNQQQNAYNAYAQQVAQQQQLSNANLNAQYGNVQNTIGRQQNYQDYQTQQNSYNQYLAKYGQRSGAQGAVGGAAAGASMGTAVMPGWGTAIGGVAGAAAGYFGSRGSY